VFFIGVIIIKAFLNITYIDFNINPPSFISFSTHKIAQEFNSQKTCWIHSKVYI